MSAACCWVMLSFVLHPTFCQVKIWFQIVKYSLPKLLQWVHFRLNTTSEMEYLRLDMQYVYDAPSEFGQGDAVSWRTASSLHSESSSHVGEGSSKASTPRSLSSNTTNYMELPPTSKCKCDMHPEIRCRNSHGQFVFLFFIIWKLCILFSNNFTECPSQLVLLSSDHTHTTPNWVFHLKCRRLSGLTKNMHQT